MELFSHRHTIPSFETDIDGHWRLSSIFTQMQEVGELHAESIGLGRETLVKNDVVWVLTKLSIEMKSYPKVYELVEIKTWYALPGKLTFERFFEFTDQNGNCIGTASSLWVMMGLKARNIIRPDRLGLDFPATVCGRQTVEIPKKISPACDDFDVRERRAQYSDIDLNGHVNNAKYIEWICDLAGISELRKKRIACLTIFYHHEVLPEQTVLLSRAENDSGFYVKGEIAESQKKAFEAEVQRI